ncbi:DUF3572 domain-containing protein [Pseudahrensia aquimaris]|uniref:DUF3572 domain-containing protein n=1 Tax=Pseudahrensia aquimaris TaxID=744461 RepID=A0ABW3FJV2_9HYPH
MTPLSKDHAETLAISGLVRLAGDDDLLMRFSSITGILPNDIREAASDPGFMVGVLDFYLSHEPDLLAWAEADGFNPEEAARARFALAPEDATGFE